MDHLFLRVKAVDVRRLQVLDQAAPEVHIDHLTAPADAQHREILLHRPGQDGKVLLIQLRGDIQTARQGLPVPGGVHVGHTPGEDQAGSSRSSASIDWTASSPRASKASTQPE